MMAALAARGRTLGELLGSGAGGYARLAITDLTLDSRQVTAGAAFIAVQGGREHGLVHAAEALARGAAIVLYEPEPKFPRVEAPSLAVPRLKARLGDLARAFYAVSPAPTLVGVTGTNGKTTVAYLLAQTLGQPQRPCAYIGTLGYGVPPQITAHGLTTPDTLTLHRELAELHTARVAMEVSSHALVQDRIAGLTFRRVHESDARSPRPARRFRELRQCEAPAVSTVGPAVRRRERRRSVRRVARYRFAARLRVAAHEHARCWRGARRSRATL
jgi:UDP-N-acetylmuramoyl-L-alanyl-D-glutamate--2,6-diaminopimelate ligase